MILFVFWNELGYLYVIARFIVTYDFIVMCDFHRADFVSCVCFHKAFQFEAVI